MEEDKKVPEGHGVENIPWRILKGLLLCVVVFSAYRHAMLERENMQLSEKSLKVETENMRLSERLLEVERKLHKLDRKVQTLWNEEDLRDYDVAVHGKQISSMSIELETVMGRMKREPQQEERTGNRPTYQKSEFHRDVIAVHIEGRADGETPCRETNSFQIEEGHDIITKWQPLRYPNDGFTLEEGILTVEKTGLYFIYSQILYLEDPEATLATTHSVYVNEEIFLTCVNSMVGVPPWHTCYTAGVMALEAEKSSIHIGMKCNGCCISLSSDATFFGAILLKEYESASPMKSEFMDIFFPNESKD